jgi:short-subunit dehydrogenase
MTAILAANLYGAMLLSQAAVAVMSPRKSGHLLHVVGILGKAPMANATVYCASKYGLSGFLAALRAEVARRHNIKVTGLYLGGVDTPFYDNPAVQMKVQRDKMLSADDAATAVLYALTQPAHLVLGELTLQPESHQL